MNYIAHSSTFQVHFNFQIQSKICTILAQQSYGVIIYESSSSYILRGLYQNYKKTKNKALNFIKINKKEKLIFSKHQKAK